MLLNKKRPKETYKLQYFMELLVKLRERFATWISRNGNIRIYYIEYQGFSESSKEYNIEEITKPRELYPELFRYGPPNRLKYSENYSKEA